MPDTDPATPATPHTQPVPPVPPATLHTSLVPSVQPAASAGRVLAADPVPAGTAVLTGMPGHPVTRDQMRTPDKILTCDLYVVQLRDAGVWRLPHHDDGAARHRGHVVYAVRQVMDRPQQPGRASVDADGTLYVANSRPAARYIPAWRVTDWQPESGTCPGCGTSYAGNGDGPCPAGRSLPTLQVPTAMERAEWMARHVVAAAQQDHGCVVTRPLVDAVTDFSSSG